MKPFPRFVLPPKRHIPSRGLHQETWLGGPWHIRKLQLPKRLRVDLSIELHTPEIIMGKGVRGREFHCSYQCLMCELEVVIGPFEEPKISVGVFHPRIQTNGFPVLGSSFGTLAQAGRHAPTKIVNSRVVRLPAFC